MEIHTDALSRDSGERLDWPRVSASLRTFEVEGVTGHAPGHLEMLRHLCHHTLEPAERIKLIALADIYGYASQFDAEIPWQILAGEHPFVVNMLTLLGCIAPPPESLRQRIPPLTAPCPRGVGEGYPPLRNTLSSGNPWHDKLRRLMTAPDWWLHCFYNVPPGNSLFTTRTVRHPVNVLRWIWRRSVAGLGDRVS